MSELKNNEFTTIQISKKIHSELKGRKIIDREPYNDVIKRLMGKDKKRIK